MVQRQAADFNLALLRAVAGGIGKLRAEVMFLGSTVLPLFVSGPAVPEIRSAKDVDFMIHAPTKQKLWEFEDQFWSIGMKKKTTGSTCHWLFGDVHVDVLTTDSDLVDFANHWGGEAMRNAQQIDLGGGMIINVIRPTHYLATKFEAFYRRGKNSYQTSRDIYDVLVFLRGCPDIEYNFRQHTSSELRLYLASELNGLLIFGTQWAEETASTNGSDEFSRQWQQDVEDRIQRIVAESERERSIKVCLQT